MSRPPLHDFEQDFKTGRVPSKWFLVLDRVGLKLVRHSALIRFDRENWCVHVKWRGRNREVYSHVITENDDLYNSDCITELKIKVMMTT